MGYYSKLDIWAKENGFKLVSSDKTPKRPIKFLYQTSRMKEPKVLDARQIKDTINVWPGCTVSAEWLRTCTEWTQVPNFDTKIKLIEWL